MKFIIGKKQEMSRVFSETGEMIPVTKVLVENCFVTAKKTLAKDGYSAIQIAAVPTKKANNPLASFFRKIFQADKFFKEMVEFRTEESGENFQQLELGQELAISMFAVGDKVSVRSKSKGRGFQGVVKRHHFKGGHATHGNKDQLRMPGSSGATHPNHVFKGIRKPGHMGDEWCTVTNLTVVAVDPEKNELLLKGAMPGARNAKLYLFAKGEFAVKAKNEEKKLESQAEPNTGAETLVTENTATVDAPAA